MGPSPPSSPKEDAIARPRSTAKNMERVNSKEKPTFDSLVQLAKSGLRAKASPITNGTKSYFSDVTAVNPISPRTPSSSSSIMSRTLVNSEGDRTESKADNSQPQLRHDENASPFSGGLSQDDIALLELGLTHRPVSEMSSPGKVIDIDELAKRQGFEVTHASKDSPPPSTLCLPQSVSTPLTPLTNGVTDPTRAVQASAESERVEISLTQFHKLLDDRNRLEQKLLSLNNMVVSGANQYENMIHDLMASLKNGSHLDVVTRPARRPDETKFIKLLADRDEEIADLQLKLESLTTQHLMDNHAYEAMTQTETGHHASKGASEQELADLRKRLDAAQQELKKNSEDLVAAKTTHVLLSEQLRTLSKHEELSKNHQSQASKLFNENRELKALLETQAKTLERLNNEQILLRGGCFLVRATSSVLLNKRTLACIDCYAENKICDNDSPDCLNCRNANQACRRFRCAKVHLFKKKCPDGGLCPLRHTGDGWLVTEHERPQW